MTLQRASLEAATEPDGAHTAYVRRTEALLVVLRTRRARVAVGGGAVGGLDRAIASFSVELRDARALASAGVDDLEHVDE